MFCLCIHARRPIWLNAFALIVLGIAVGVPGDAAALQSPPREGPTRETRTTLAKAASLRLRNATADTLRVEVKVGPGDRCEDAHPAGTRAVAPGRSWLVAADQPICWRVAADPTVLVTRWTSWQRRTLATGARAEEALSPR